MGVARITSGKSFLLTHSQRVEGALVRKRISSGITRGRAVGLAAATVMAGGVAAGLMASPAFADPGPVLIATNTVVTNVAMSQQPNDPGSAMLTVHVSVTAKGGTSAPTGDVIISAGSDNCAAAMTGPAASAVSTGSCNIANMANGTYAVSAAYQGADNWSGSSTANKTQVIISMPSQTDVVSWLSCSKSVNIGGSGSCTLTVKNDGSSTATGITAEIALPSRLSARSCGHGWGWGPLTGHGGGCSLTGHAATWQIRSLTAGASRSETLRFTAGQNGYPWDFGRSHHSQDVTVHGSAVTASQRHSNSRANVMIHPRAGWFW